MRILLADDHPLFREGVKPVLLKLDASVEIIEAVDYPGAFDAMRAAGEVDLALLDLNMPGMTSLEGIQKFRATFSDTPLIVLSAADRTEEIRKVLAAGAMGYISKASSPEVIISAMHLVLAGGVYAPPELLAPRSHAAVDPAPIVNHGHRAHGLTDRQIEVLQLLAQGKSNRQIADDLHLTEGTVKIHAAAIFRTLGVANRIEATLAAQRMGVA